MNVNVYDKAHELARAIKQSEAYRQLHEAKKKLGQDSKAIEMVDDFRKKQLEVEQARLLGLELPEDKLKNLDNLFSVISHNPVVVEFFQAELAFFQLMNDIQDILHKMLGNDL